MKTWPQIQNPFERKLIESGIGYRGNGERESGKIKIIVFIRADGYSGAADIFYSIETDKRKSLPLRIVIYTDEDARDVFLIWEIFKFRLGTPDPEVFEFPELAVC